MERKVNVNLLKIAMTGLLTALVFALSYMRIPLSSDGAAIHLGNIMCLLSGMLMGGLYGGAAAGLGSMLYDFTNPLYISSAPITFINKFMMGFVAGTVNSKLKIKNPLLRAFIAGILGQATYVVLYLGKTYVSNLLLGNAWQTAFIMMQTKAVTSSVNAIIAVSISVPLYMALRPALRKLSFTKGIIQ